MEWDEATTFGPPSELFSVSDFLKEGEELEEQHDSITGFEDPSVVHGSHTWDSLAAEVKTAIEVECRLDGIGEDASVIIKNPKLSRYLRTRQETGLTQPEDAHLAGSTKKAKTSGKRRPKINGLVPPETVTDANEDPDVAELNDTMSLVKLSSWVTPPEATLFIRASRTEDQNSLSTIKANPVPSEDGSSSISLTETVAIVTLSNYARASVFPHQFKRISQHAILSSQSLGDLFDNIPCQHKEIPREIMNPDGTVAVGWDETSSESTGVAICIEDVVHGDGLSRPDYADKLKDFVNKKGPGLVRKGPLMHDTRFASLEIRLHQPYWLLHQGDCEHYIVFDQIRLAQASDPKTGYPIMIQQTPTRVPICKICYRRPPELSVVGDPRIGEGVALICRSCWKALGEPVEGRDEPVMVVPLIASDDLV